MVMTRPPAHTFFLEFFDEKQKITKQRPYLLMPLDKCNSITAIATDLISSLFNIGNVPFHQLQQLQCLHHGSTKAHLCSPLGFLSYCIGDNLQYAHYGFGARLRQVQYKQRHFLLEHSVFFVMAGLIIEIFFMQFSANNTAYNGLKMSKYEAYWLTGSLYWMHTKK